MSTKAAWRNQVIFGSLELNQSLLLGRSFLMYSGPIVQRLSSRALKNGGEMVFRKSTQSARSLLCRKGNCTFEQGPLLTEAENFVPQTY